MKIDFIFIFSQLLIYELNIQIIYLEKFLNVYTIDTKISNLITILYY